MIERSDCRACGAPLWADTLGGLVIRTELLPLDGPGAVTALVGGGTLYRIRTAGNGTPLSFTGAGPEILGGLPTTDPAARPYIVQEHRCAALSGDVAPRPVVGDPKDLTSAPAARETPSSVPSVEPSGVRSAASPVSEPLWGPEGAQGAVVPAAGGPQGAPKAEAVTGPSPRPSTGRTEPRSADSRQNATGPSCSNCSKPMADGTYASIELGELLVWAAHIDSCPA